MIKMKKLKIKMKNNMNKNNHLILYKKIKILIY